MNPGTEKVKHKILDKLKKYKAVLRNCKYGEFADELTDEIDKLFGGDMNQDMQVIAMARGFSPKDLEICKKVEKTFGFDQVSMRPEDIEVYRWIYEQETKGQTLRDFVTWAKHPDRLQYIRKYRKSANDIKIDWELAFTQKNSQRMLASDEGI